MPDGGGQYKLFGEIQWALFLKNHFDEIFCVRHSTSGSFFERYICHFTYHLHFDQFTVRHVISCSHIGNEVVMLYHKPFIDELKESIEFKIFNKSSDGIEKFDL